LHTSLSNNISLLINTIVRHASCCTHLLIWHSSVATRLVTENVPDCVIMTVKLCTVQQAMCVFVEDLSCIHCCSGNAISITYSECTFVALFIQHAMPMRHAILSVSCPFVSYYSTLSVSYYSTLYVSYYSTLSVSYYSTLSYIIQHYLCHIIQHYLYHIIQHYLCHIIQHYLYHIIQHYLSYYSTLSVSYYSTLSVSYYSTLPVSYYSTLSIS
jgi:hypothetical protein